ncbi:DUF2225 domain-containing protein [bacterium]|nr:DUF2225 domain-containing protein [bacterium]
MGTRLIEQAFVCPICGRSFTAKVVESVTHQGQDSDFYPHYIGDNPLPHFLVQCKECFYCAYPDDFFTDHNSVPGLKMNQIQEILNQPIAKKIPQEGLRFFLAGKLYEIQKRNPYLIGNLYLRGSWCCRLAQDRRAEIELQQLSVKFLRESVERTTISNPDNVAIVTYLVGEIYRRLEDKNLAREWFKTVEENLVDPEQQQWLLELTRNQAELNEHFIN